MHPFEVRYQAAYQELEVAGCEVVVHHFGPTKFNNLQKDGFNTSAIPQMSSPISTNNSIPQSSLNALDAGPLLLPQCSARFCEQ